MKRKLKIEELIIKIVLAVILILDATEFTVHKIRTIRQTIQSSAAPSNRLDAKGNRGM